MNSGERCVARRARATRVTWPSPREAGQPQGGSGGFLEQLTADQHEADFTGAGADLVKLGVTQQPTGRVFVDVAVAAQKLDRVERHLGRGLGSEQDGTGRIIARGLATVAGTGDGVDIGAAGVQTGIDIRQLALNELELPDRNIELL